MAQNKNGAITDIRAKANQQMKANNSGVKMQNHTDEQSASLVPSLNTSTTNRTKKAADKAIAMNQQMLLQHMMQ